MHVFQATSLRLRLFNGISKPLEQLIKENKDLISMQSNAVAQAPSR